MTYTFFFFSLHSFVADLEGVFHQWGLASKHHLDTEQEVGHQPLILIVMINDCWVRFDHFMHASFNRHNIIIVSLASDNLV